MPWPLYPQGKSPWYPLDRRLGEPQSRSGCGGEEKNFQPLPGLEIPIIQPVAQRYTIELYLLLANPRTKIAITVKHHQVQVILRKSVASQ
jgi:hypothetical protein